MCNGMGDITALERMNYSHIVSSMSGDIDAFLVPPWHQSKAGEGEMGDYEKCFKCIPVHTVLDCGDKFKPISLNNTVLN